MIEMEGFKQDLAEVRRMLAESAESLHIDHLREQLVEYQEDMGSPGFWDDTDRAQNSPRRPAASSAGCSTSRTSLTAPTTSRC